MTDETLTPAEITQLEREAYLAVAAAAWDYAELLPASSEWQGALTHLAVRLEGRPPLAKRKAEAV